MKLTHIMMVAICNLHVGYGHCIVKQTMKMFERKPLRLLMSFVGHPLYRVSQEERANLREGVPYVKLYRYNPKHLYPMLNGYGDNGQRILKL